MKLCMSTVKTYIKGGFCQECRRCHSKFFASIPIPEEEEKKGIGTYKECLRRVEERKEKRRVVQYVRFNPKMVNSEPSQPPCSYLARALLCYN